MKLKRPQVLLFFVNAFFWMTIYAYVPNLPVYARDSDASVAMVGLITGSYGIMQILLRFPLGMLSDRLRRRKPFILAGIAVGIASSVLMFLIGTPLALLAGRLMAGLSACAYVQMTVLFSSYYDMRHMSKSLGLVEGSSAAGQLAAMLLGGLAASLFSARYTFLLAALLGVVGLAIASFTQESRIERKPASFAQIGSALRERTLITASVLAIFALAVLFSKGFVYTPLFASVFNPSPMQQSALLMLVLLPIAVFSPLTGSRLVPRFGTRAIVAAGFAMQAASCAIVPFASSIGWLYISQFVTGIGYGLAFPSLMALSISNMPADKRATAMGFFQAVYGIGIFAGPWVSGLLTAGLGQNPPFFISAGLAVLAAAGALLTISAGAGSNNQSISISK
jgi:MFS family permease